MKVKVKVKKCSRLSLCILLTMVVLALFADVMMVRDVVTTAGDVMLVTAPLSCCKILIYQQREVFTCLLPSLLQPWQYCGHHPTVQSKMLIEKGHWRLQPLYRPNQPSGKT